MVEFDCGAFLLTHRIQHNFGGGGDDDDQDGNGAGGDIVVATDLSRPKREHGSRRPYTVQQVAERLNCSDDHVRTLIAHNHLPSVRVPGLGRRAGRVLVMPGDLDKAIESWRSA